MFKVYCDDKILYDPRGEEVALIDPRLEIEVNQAGSFAFTMPPTHLFYDLPQKMTSVIRVMQDDDELFRGRIINVSIDFYKRKKCECEGQLAYLNDSLQRPAEYHGATVRGYLETLIKYHNKQMGDDTSKQFEVGIVTVTDPDDSLYRYTNYNSTLTEIKEDLVDDLGGYLRVRNVGEHHYLDLIAEHDNMSAQTIEFGENLLDFTRNMDLSDIVTAVVPLGAKLDESPIEALEQRLTIESVNGGSDTIVAEDAVKTYGYIEGTVTWDGITTPEYLLKKGQKYLSSYQFDNMVIECSAIDLHWTDSQIEQFKLGDNIRVISTPHGMDKWFPLTKISITINDLASTKFTLGSDASASLTAQSKAVSKQLDSAVETIPTINRVVKEAEDNASALITAATTGHVVTRPDEILIMDTDDKATAKKLWRWNVNGLGYSSTGYNGTYGTAITMDGTILGERLVGGSVTANKIDINYTSQVLGEASDTTDGKLKNYYTQSEVETKIKSTSDSILLSVSETYTNKDSVRSQFAMNKDSITIDTGVLSFNSNSIVIDSDNFKLTASGDVTMMGDLYNRGLIGKLYNTTMHIDDAMINVYASSDETVNYVSIGATGSDTTSLATNIDGTITLSSYYVTAAGKATKYDWHTYISPSEVNTYFVNVEQRLSVAGNAFVDGSIYLGDELRLGGVEGKYYLLANGVGVLNDITAENVNAKSLYVSGKKVKLVTITGQSGYSFLAVNS